MESITTQNYLLKTLNASILLEYFITQNINWKVYFLQYFHELHHINKSLKFYTVNTLKKINKYCAKNFKLYLKDFLYI